MVFRDNRRVQNVIKSQSNLYEMLQTTVTLVNILIFSK